MKKIKEEHIDTLCLFMTVVASISPYLFAIDFLGDDNPIIIKKRKKADSEYKSMIPKWLDGNRHF